MNDVAIETNDFRNDGFGWRCRHCDRELGDTMTEPGTHPRFMFEGEAESKSPKLSMPSLARWADAERRTLSCPRCGITERIDIA